MGRCVGERMGSRAQFPVTKPPLYALTKMGVAWGRVRLTESATAPASVPPAPADQSSPPLVTQRTPPRRPLGPVSYLNFFDPLFGVPWDPPDPLWVGPGFPVVYFI